MLIYDEIIYFNIIQLVMFVKVFWPNKKGRENISKLNEY